MKVYYNVLGASAVQAAISTSVLKEEERNSLLGIVDPLTTGGETVSGSPVVPFHCNFSFASKSWEDFYRLMKQASKQDYSQVFVGKAQKSAEAPVLDEPTVARDLVLIPTYIQTSRFFGTLVTTDLVSDLARRYFEAVQMFKDFCELLYRKGDAVTLMIPLLGVGSGYSVEDSVWVGSLVLAQCQALFQREKNKTIGKVVLCAPENRVQQRAFRVYLETLLNNASLIDEAELPLPALDHQWGAPSWLGIDKLKVANVVREFTFKAQGLSCAHVPEEYFKEDRLGFVLDQMLWYCSHLQLALCPDTHKKLIVRGQKVASYAHLEGFVNKAKEAIRNANKPHSSSHAESVPNIFEVVIAELNKKTEKCQAAYAEMVMLVFKLSSILRVQAALNLASVHAPLPRKSFTLAAEGGALSSGPRAIPNTQRRDDKSSDSTCGSLPLPLSFDPSDAARQNSSPDSACESGSTSTVEGDGNPRRRSLSAAESLLNERAALIRASSANAGSAFRSPSTLRASTLGGVGKKRSSSDPPGMPSESSATTPGLLNLPHGSSHTPRGAFVILPLRCGGERESRCSEQPGVTLNLEGLGI